MSDEVWKPIPSVPGYEASSWGRVRNVETLRVLASRIHKGYKLAKIGGRPRAIHRLVCEAFHGPSDLTVNHIDGVKANNRPGNLEWMSAADNASHAHRAGIIRQDGTENSQSKLCELRVRAIRSLYRHGDYLMRELAEMFGVGPTQVHRIIHRRKWTWLD